MFKQIKDVGEEIIDSNDDDLIPIQQSGITGRIKKVNLLTGFSGGSADKFIQLLDKKSAGVNGGFAIVSTWATKDINYINSDETNEVILSDNLFILPSGTYQIDLRTTFYALADTKIRIFNTTDQLAVLYGLNTYFNPSNGPAFQTSITGKFSIGANKQLALQYWTKPATNINQYNFGGSVSDGSPEVYTIIDLWKI
ncbi:MAG: hypothetical protein V7K47_02230 [Nostoc sp.]